MLEIRLTAIVGILAWVVVLACLNEFIVAAHGRQKTEQIARIGITAHIIVGMVLVALIVLYVWPGYNIGG
jgi:hypothetical protein